MTWPSFLAASIRAGVTGSGGGASARTRVENAAPASNAPVPLSMSRRDILGCFIWLIIRLFWRDLVHHKLSFIPTARCESFVDSSLPLPLDLTAGSCRPPVHFRKRPQLGRLK